MSITWVGVQNLLTEVFLIRGMPRLIRLDNGPESIAEGIKEKSKRMKLYVRWFSEHKHDTRVR